MILHDIAISYMILLYKLMILKIAWDMCMYINIYYGDGYIYIKWNGHSWLQPGDPNYCWSSSKENHGAKAKKQHCTPKPGAVP